MFKMLNRTVSRSSRILVQPRFYSSQSQNSYQYMGNGMEFIKMTDQTKNKQHSTNQNSINDNTQINSFKEFLTFIRTDTFMNLEEDWDRQMIKRMFRVFIFRYSKILIKLIWKALFIFLANNYQYLILAVLYFYF